ncbi:2Fe-2S iron-sulfur cluster-binding protein [Dyadobacter crusticola]|uniref:2Fe-2S iron-sulfur cluster-binding protein n=1 Tax=Dyadobacter crusticola TaxID=292407 RepID=UPI000556957C|nr:2Fe-2S iron-sulfur cluster-binding protein [Dyadobacter crusticola]
MTSFTIVFNGKEYQVQAGENRHFSLMSLISEQLAIPGFGLCSGMGSCGTCIVEMNGRNALSCSVAIDHSLANAVIRIEQP